MKRSVLLMLLKRVASGMIRVPENILLVVMVLILKTFLVIQSEPLVVSLFVPLRMKRVSHCVPRRVRRGT